MTAVEVGTTDGVAATPAVSWLVCTHVANDLLRQALRSCFDQTFSDFELVVVANGQDSATIVSAVREWFGEDDRLRVVGTDIRHLNFSLNLGLHLCRAELVARMDGDDLSSPDRLTRQVEFMRAHPDVVVLGTDYAVIDLNGRPCGGVSLPTADGDIRWSLLWRNPLCHPAVMFRRDAVRHVGGYLGAIHAEDYDLWSRLALNPSNRFANLSQPLLSYRSAGVGMARRSRHAYAAVAAAQWRNFILGAGALWAVAAVFSSIKAIVRSDRPADLR